MIIPDGHDQEQTPKPVDKSSRVLTVPVAYQNKVDTMLTKMKPDTTIRIGRVCKKENQPMFIQAIKNFICSNDWGGGIVFTNDWTGFRKHETPDTRDQDQDDRIEHQNTINRDAVARRNLAFRYWRQRLKMSPIPKFCHNSAEYAITDPKATINSGLTALKHAPVGGRVFDAWVNRMESLAAGMQKHDGNAITFSNHNKPTVFNPTIQKSKFT